MKFRRMLFYISLILIALPTFADEPQVELGPPEEIVAWPFAAIENEDLAPEPAALQTPEAQVRRAVESYRTSGQAAVLERSTTTLYPYGESQPVVRCTPLRACDVELQAGETITAVALGDAERWIVSPLESGPPEATVPHVIIKPKDFGLATNLVVGTTHRTYHLGLLSPPAADAGEPNYDRHVAFYYPNDLVVEWSAVEERVRKAAAQRDTATTADLRAPALEELHFDYRILARGRRQLAWRPSTIFDDGQHVYIQLPPAIRTTDLPALLLETADGALAVANYRFQGAWLIVDSLFEKAQLVTGVGRKKRSLTIVREPAGARS